MEFYDTDYSDIARVKQLNMMYKAAKKIGFPGKIFSGLKSSSPFHVTVSVPICFDAKNYKRYKRYKRYPPSKDYYSFFYIFRFQSNEPDYIYHHIFLAKPNEEYIPSTVLWLLVCMKLFYKKEWNRNQWIDQEVYKHAFTDLDKVAENHNTSMIPSSLHLNQHETLIEPFDIEKDLLTKVSAYLAKNIDDEIIKSLENKFYSGV